MTDIILAQTLSGDWIISIPNPEEAGWETELARFESGSATSPNTLARTTLDTMAAETAVRLAFNGGTVTVRSHDKNERNAMRKLVRTAGGTQPLDVAPLVY